MPNTDGDSDPRCDLSGHSLVRTPEWMITLTPVVVYKPAAPGQPLHVVVRQIPAKGGLSSYDKVTIVFAKPLHGIVPKVVGLRLPQAREELARLKLAPVLRGHGTKIVRQRPRAGVAAAPRMKITLWVTGG